MYIIADLQLHSKYSRAVSKHMTLPSIASWAEKKGIQLVATGDWTHPLWMKEIIEQMEETGSGFLRLKQSFSEGLQHPPLFVLATEVSCIYSQGGKGRRIHILIWVPSLASALAINKEMTKRGCNLLSDGRPIIGLTSKEVSELVFSLEEKAVIIPAHAWTPWFGLFGSMSGFDSIQEAFGSYADRIYAVETGLSSNPQMNWQIQELDTRTIVSFSDAHSGPKLGREATVFSFEGALSEFTYEDLYAAVRNDTKNNSKNKKLCSIAYTIEFFPEEGKYHFSGHRACSIRWDGKQTSVKGTICPVCGKPLTQGVVQRVEELAVRSEKSLEVTNVLIPLSDDGPEITFVKSNVFPDRPPFCMMVPLLEIISECIHSPVTSPKVEKIYMHLIHTFGSEFNILLSVHEKDIESIAGTRIAKGITQVRLQDIYIDPGYDGVFGVVKLWKDDNAAPVIDASKEQLTLF